MKFKLFTKKKLKYGLVICMLLLTFMILLAPPVFKLKKGPIFIKRQLANGQIKTFEYGPQLPGWIRYEHFPELFIKAVVVTEDMNFWWHSGIDFFEIQASFRRNWKAGKIVRGGSTITQQMVKNAFLTNKRSYVRKFRELEGTLYVEKILTKKQILAWYLNIIEFGTDIYGVGYAAKRYFGKAISQLSPRECVMLAIILPNPKKYGASLLAQDLSPRLRKRFAWTAMLLKQYRYISDEEWQELMAGGNFGSPLDGSKVEPEDEFIEEEEDTEVLDNRQKDLFLDNQESPEQIEETPNPDPVLPGDSEEGAYQQEREGD